MFATRLSRAVSKALAWDASQFVLANFCMQLPRATSAASRSAILRKPLTPAFARFESTGGEEKVKGAVIGIDLGKCHPHSNGNAILGRLGHD